VPNKVPQVHNATFQRRQQTKAAERIQEEDVDVEPNRTREELMALVDQYSGESYTDQLPVLELPRLYQPSDGPHITVSDNVEDEWPPPHQAWFADLETQIKLEKLKNALKYHFKDPDEIYELYRALPEPRAPYLESETRHRMLHHLAVVESKNEHSMLRYLSVIDDMKGTAIPLTTTEWTSAISFAASYTAKSTEVEVEAALVMWKEMEHIAGVKGNGATFNVLFDVACKAGKFTLAEMINKEMLTRGFDFDRYHHVSMIFYHGLMKNGDGARAAYKALVDADEIVDTVVLNAMISALIRSHEAHAAENIYERMKRSHLERPGAQLQPKDFRARRLITRTLKMMAIVSKTDKTKREEFQRRSIIAPDRQTFQILLHHFAVQAGEMGKTAKFLEEMTLFDIAPHNALFVPILKAFATHGGIRYTRWTESRLEAVWKSLMQALDDKVEGVDISRWLVIWAIRAFAKCSGKSRTVKVWEEIKQIWDPGEADLDFIMYELRLVLDGPDMAERKDDWVLGHSYNNKGYV
jgi:pentatricopeptide repeat protein